MMAIGNTWSMVVLTVPIETEDIFLSDYSHCRRAREVAGAHHFFNLLGLVTYSYIFYSLENMTRKSAPQTSSKGACVQKGKESCKDVRFLVLWDLVLKGNVTDFLVPGASPSKDPLGRAVTAAGEWPDPGWLATCAPVHDSLRGARVLPPSDEGR